MTMSQQQVEVSFNSSIPSTAPVPLLSMGPYSIYPMEVCSEDQIAQLFVKVSQRGNPVLQGRPAADVELLGRAMYRKTMLMRMGQVVMHSGKPVALSCNWDAGAGGVWEGSGLTMPSSLLAHAAVGKAVFASLPERSGSTFFAAFYGVLPKHPGSLFGVLGTASLMLAKDIGFEHSFQYTLLPTLKDRGAFGGNASADEETWGVKFADVPTSDVAVSEELTELGGTCNCSLMTLEYGTGAYVKVCADIVRLKNPDELRVPSQAAASKHMQFLRGEQTPVMSRL